MVPKPCTAKYIAEIETWEKTQEVLTKEEVMLAQFGYADERAIPAVSILQSPLVHCAERGAGGEVRGGKVGSLVMVLVCKCGFSMLVSGF